MEELKDLVEISQDEVLTCDCGSIVFVQPMSIIRKKNEVMMFPIANLPTYCLGYRLKIDSDTLDTMKTKKEYDSNMKNIHVIDDKLQ